VAAYFGKRHGNVLRDIDDLLTGMNDSSDLSSRWFRAADYQTSTGNSAVRTYAAYDMTRQGFTLLAMRFTGKKALRFQIRYIEEFERMEAKLKAQTPALPNFSNPAEAARAWEGKLVAVVTLVAPTSYIAPNYFEGLLARKVNSSWSASTV